jgi:polyisoprenoid-binding protein YceI
MNGIISLPLRTGRWTSVAALTHAAFAVGNLGGLKTVHGSVPITEAWVEVDETGPSAVHATLDLTAIDTGHRKRDSDLRKPYLLDAARHPTLTFDGGRARPVDGRWQVPGRLTGRAATDVILSVEEVEGTDPGVVSIRATVRLDRRELGVKAPRFMIGRSVDVTIEACFRPPN